jgi:hypothetical protein
MNTLGGTLSVKFEIYVHQTTIFKGFNLFFIPTLLCNFLIYTY